MTRALILRQVDALHCKDHDRVVAKCVGMIAAGAFILLAIAHDISHH